MSQTVHEDLESGNSADGDQPVTIDRRSARSRTPSSRPSSTTEPIFIPPIPGQQPSIPVRLTPTSAAEEDDNQSPPNQQSQPSQEETSFSDSSGPLFSIYSKAAEEEDNKMVERWQKDADGILIFTGLFSATLASLLTVTIKDLRSNSQDIFAFYLGNIYEVLADPNVTHASIPAPAAKPPPFSAPRYAVWVNSLWFLSLVMSLSCALLATSLHQWARRYIRLTQPARTSPEKRARRRAFFANGVDEMHVPWAVEGLPTLLHLSLFLFFGGLAIFLFNVDQEVFICVVCWIGLFLMVYGLITLLPLIRHESPYYTPLSHPAWFSIPYVTFKVLVFFISSKRCRDLRDRYRGRMLWDVENKAEEVASKRSSKIDIRILGWTISALGDDDSLEKFFEVIPGFFTSKLVMDLERDFPETLLDVFWGALDGLMGRTLSSDFVTKSVKSRRGIICREIMSTIPCPHQSRYPNLHFFFNQGPVSIEMLQVMRQWLTHLSKDVSRAARFGICETLARVDWHILGIDFDLFVLASDMFGLTTGELVSDAVLGRNNVLLDILNHVSRRAAHSEELLLLEALTKFDIRRATTRLKRDFCTLWNELVQEANNQEGYNFPIDVLQKIRRLYIDLHEGTDAAPAAFASTRDYDSILFQPSTYPLCNIAGHYPLADSTTSITSYRHLTNYSPATIYPPPIPSATFSTPTSPHPTDASPPRAAAAALQDISPAATLSHPLEGTTQWDIVAPCAEPDISEISSATPMPAPTPLELNKPLVSHDTGATSASNPLIPASSVIGFSIPASPSSSVPLLPDMNQDFLSLFSSTTPSRPISNVTPPRLRARGLVNSGNMCFANTVLQLLVHSPPFWNLFRELGDLKEQRGARGTEPVGGVTPLVDATVRFFEEIMLKDRVSPPTQQPLQQDVGGKSREDEAKKEHDAADSFKPTYIYDAMKKKRKLKHLLDGKHEDAEEFLGVYLDALDEELVELHTYISTHKPASALSVEELEGEAQSAEGQTEVGKREYMASSVESPISRIFGGKSRSILRAPSQTDAITIEAWRSLQLNIQPSSVRTIQDALAHVSQPQSVQVGQSCSSEATQQILLEALPPVLVLHLNRFVYDAAVDGIHKISKPVQFAPELDIPPEIMAPVVGTSAEPMHYKLHGVLYHHGESADRGHYTVDLRHPNEDNCCGGSWLHIDDEVVSAVPHEVVFGSRDNELGNDQCVYMLFYCRTAPTHT